MDELEKYLKIYIKQGRTNLKKRQDGTARDYFDKALVLLTDASLNGITEIAGKSVNKWKTRVWNLLENNDLLLLTEEEKLSM